MANLSPLSPCTHISSPSRPRKKSKKLVAKSRSCSNARKAGQYLSHPGSAQADFLYPWPALRVPPRRSHPDSWRQRRQTRRFLRAEQRQLPRIFFTLGLLFVYRLGGHIPTPGVNADKLADFFAQNKGSFLGFVDLFSGGQLRRLTIFALGIMPYITRSEEHTSALQS